ncbi:DUF3613 domain-containing protein [Halomonas mongoliensis]|uniref:DUF3613 domain-containing protein n=1 Tax=Halomonas mongoliensis TaxID=321265 RepID=UPI00403A9E58
MKRPELCHVLPPALLLAMLLGAAPALANDSASPTAEPRGETHGPMERSARSTPAPGDATRRLLEQQRAGHYASSNDQWLSGDVQREVYRRYVNSFSRPIPERFIDDGFSN